jgi:hypothetical protein
MKSQTSSLPACFLTLVFFLLLASWLPVVPAKQGVEGTVVTELAQAQGVDLGLEQLKANALLQVMPLEVLGSLAPIALSPFFALTCLSGASLMADQGLLPSGLASNYIVGSESPLNHEIVFIGLLALTLLTSAPKLTKVSKPFAQAVDQLEAYSGIIAALAVQFLHAIATSDLAGASPASVVVHAGFVELSLQSFALLLLMAFSAMNLFVINSVKFFCEVMILISPIPFVDAAFEVANKAFAMALVGLYLFSPWVAAVVNLLLFFLCLLVFSWTFRRVVFMRSVLIDPMLGWLSERVFGGKPPALKSSVLPAKVVFEGGEPAVVLKAFAGRRSKGIPTKSQGYLVQVAGSCHFVRPRLGRSAVIVPLGLDGIRPELRKGLFSHSLLFRDAHGQTVSKVLLTRRFTSLLPELASQLHAVEQGARAGSASGDAAPKDMKAELA